MSQVETAIANGQCSIAIGAALLRDPGVMLALTERAALSPMALSGPTQAPVADIGDQGLARAVATPGGVLVFVENGPEDQTGLERLAKMISSAPHKPSVVVVSKSFNLFTMSALFRGLKIEHIKARGKAWMETVPMPPAGLEPAPVLASAKERRKKAEGPVPQLRFVGREEQLAELTGFLGTGGPIVVMGPRGMGKSWIIAHAIAASGLTRLPDLRLGRAVGADTVLARLAEITRAGGSDALAQTLSRTHTPPEAVEAAIRSLKDASGTEGQVMVIDDLHVASGRTGEFFRKSRLELLMEALLTHEYPLRLVFTSRVRPLFFREGRDAPLRRLTLEGLKGRHYHEVFEAYITPDFPRDRFGPLSERLHGNPLAVRTAAVAIRHNLELSASEKFFKMDDAGDAIKICKQVEKRVIKLDDKRRSLLHRAAHLNYPVDGATLADMGIGRRDRNHLVAEGLLDLAGTEDNRQYQVHDVVKRVLDAREISNFRTLSTLGSFLASRAEKAEGVYKLALQQEANQCFATCRQFDDLLKLEFADNDIAVDSCLGLIRGRTPHFEMATQRIGAVLAADPGNSDAHLVKIELLNRQDAKNADIQAAVDTALEAAPAPEIFHEAVGFHLRRNARNKAIRVLEGGIQTLPDQTRLRTRLAALLLRAGRRPEAIDHLKRAMEQDPMLPDAYGLLGMARREEGTDALEEAETLLREAVRLAPNDVVQTSRLIGLLLDIAKGVPERTEPLREEVKDLLDALLAADKDSWETNLLYSRSLRQSGGDISRARWFLKQARKLAPRRRSLEARFELERALIELAEGKLDEAENHLRGLGRKEPSNHRVFGALAQVLEARGQLVAAFAETQRASERTSPHSLDRQAYEAEMARLQAQIAAGAVLLATPAAPEVPAAEDTATAEAKTAAVQDAPPANVEAAPVQDAPPAVEAAPVQDAPPAVEAAPVQDAPLAVEAAPVQDAPPAVEAAPVQDAPPAAEDAPVQDTAPAAVEATPGPDVPATEAAPPAPEQPAPTTDAAPGEEPTT